MLLFCRKFKTIRRNTSFILLIVALFLIHAAQVTAVEKNKQIITAGPSWEKFTNKDGTGLYHEIIREIYSGYEIKHIYVPTVQANSMVAIGRADIKMCETEDIDSLVLSDIPMYENDFYALYLQTRIPVWQGLSSLKGKLIVWREGYYSTQDFPVHVDYTQVRSGQSALQMVILGRADFYVDDLNLIKQSFETVEDTLDLDRFGLEKVGTRKYFPVFAKTPRGEELKSLYEKEMMHLYLSGALQKVYKRWGFNVPEFAKLGSGQ